MRQQCSHCGYWHDMENELIYPDLYRDSDALLVADSLPKAKIFCQRFTGIGIPAQPTDRNYCQYCDCECDYCHQDRGCRHGQCPRCKCVPVGWCRRCNHECPDCRCATEYCTRCEDHGHSCGAEHEIPGHRHLPELIRWISSESIIDTAVGGQCMCATRNGCNRHYPQPPDNKPYLGLEIELEGVECKPFKLAYLWNRCGLGWAKRDGSLADGVECCTFPTTFESLVQSNFADLIDEMRKMGARAWDTRTCGLHIHINRKAFNGRSHEWKFVRAHMSMAGHLRTLAGRASIKHSQWTDEYNYLHGLHPESEGYRHPPTDIIAGKAFVPDHYSAINLENENTIELRYWRGTTLPAGILGPAAIELALFHWSKAITVREIANGLSWDKFIQWTQDNCPLEFEKITDFMDLRTKYMNKIERNAKLCA